MEVQQATAHIAQATAVRTCLWSRPRSIGTKTARSSDVRPEAAATACSSASCSRLNRSAGGGGCWPAAAHASAAGLPASTAALRKAQTCPMTELLLLPLQHAACPRCLPDSHLLQSLWHAALPPGAAWGSVPGVVWQQAEVGHLPPAATARPRQSAAAAQMHAFWLVMLGRPSLPRRLWNAQVLLG